MSQIALSTSRVCLTCKIFKPVLLPLLTLLLTSISVAQESPLQSQALRNVQADEASEARFEMTDIGTLGGMRSQANSVNNDGVVVGQSENLDGQTRAFIWKDGKIREIPGTTAYDINDDETVVGSIQSGSRYYRESKAFQWTSSTGVDDGIMPRLNDGLSPKKLTGHARAINNNGDIAMVGQGIAMYAILRKSSGSSLDLGHFGGMISLAYDVNDGGEVVGYSKVGRRAVAAFLYQHGKLIDLGNLGGDSGAHGINNKTEVVGSSKLRSGKFAAFLWQDGNMKDLGSLGGGGSNARSINDQTVIVGQSKTSDGSKAAFIWQGGEMTNLNDLVDNADGWEITDAFKVNNKNQIAGVATKNGIQHAVLISPSKKK